MYIACSSLVCKKDKYPGISDAFRKIKELGFQSVDVAAFENWQNINPSELVSDNGDAAAAEVNSLLSETGMTVCSINAGLSRQLSDPDPQALETVKKEFAAVLKFALKINARNITLQPGKLPASGAIEDSIRTLAAALKEISSISKGSGVTVSLEGHQGSILEKPQNSLQIMEGVWPQIGLTYDPSHYVMQQIRLEETEPLLKYTMHVHVRNAAVKKMQASMQDGSVDFAWMVKALKVIDYKGALAVEYFNGFDADFGNTCELRDLINGLI